MDEPRDKEAGSGNGADEAAAWVVHMASGQRTQGDEHAFREWLARSPANAEQYREHLMVWDGIGALADNANARTILGHSPTEAAIESRHSIGRRRLLVGGAVAALVASVTPFLLHTRKGTVDFFRDGELYETKVGEQRRVTLADGSSVMINTASRLRVVYSNSERRLLLESGQAFFQVDKNTDRPFRVFVGEEEVRAIGTAFDIRRDGDITRVTLEEGVVALYRGTMDRGAAPSLASGSPRPGADLDRPRKIMQAGQQAEIDAEGAITLGEADIRQAQAWRYGRLILDNAALGSAIAELNRYGTKQIVLGEPSLADLRVSGVFHTDRPDAFIDGVTMVLPVRLARDSGNRLLLQRR